MKRSYVTLLFVGLATVSCDRARLPTLSARQATSTNHAISAAVSDGWFSLNTLTGINISTVTITANGDNAFEIHEDQANAISRQWSLRCIAGGSGSIHVENPATLPDDFSVTCTDDRDEDDVGAGN